MAFEVEFDIKIPEEDAAKMITVKDIIDYLEKEVG
jgi:acyl carrier protein